MPSYTIKAEAATTKVRNQAGTDKVFHHFEFKPNGTATAGSIIIQARRPGGRDTDLVAVDDLDFSSYKHINFTGPVAEWIFVVQSFTGDASLINVTVTSTATGKAEGEGIDPADQAKLDAITSTGSGQVMTTEERDKLSGLSFYTDEDQFLEGLAFGNLYAKTVTAG